MTLDQIPPKLLARFRQGTVIPAMPLALDSRRKLDPVRQRALIRYYHAAGAGGLAVGVHTTQFEIRDPKYGLFEPVLGLAAVTLDSLAYSTGRSLLKIAGVCGGTAQALREARVASRMGYHAALLSLAALKGTGEKALVAHCRKVSGEIPLIGFYLQKSVGGPVLSYDFWRRFFDIPNVLGAKIAPFDRYQTLDVVRALAASGREREITLYTGNDDNIVPDLLTAYRVKAGGRTKTIRIKGGLLGHWAVWTRKAVSLLEEIHKLTDSGRPVPPELLRRGIEITDCNAAFFDPAHDFKGCIAGLHYVLKRQGLMKNILCLKPAEKLSSGQAREIERVYRSYPHLHDDAFVRSRLRVWLRPRA